MDQARLDIIQKIRDLQGDVEIIAGQIKRESSDEM